MSKKYIAVLMTAVAISVQAQTINITGKVSNSTGSGISGALVKLASKNISATTDASGNYSIKGTTNVNVSFAKQVNNAIMIRNGIITLNITQPDLVRIELFDVQGNLVKRVLDRQAASGIYKFDLTQNTVSSNVMLVRVSCGNNCSTFRYLPVSNEFVTGGFTAAHISDNVSAELTAVTDSLQASASGYTSKTVKITSYETTADITLETANCKATASKASSATVTGTGPHKVVIETNSDPGIKNGTIFRPGDLGPGKKYPIFVWGEGACSQDGLSNKAAMGEFASWGYFIVADGSSAGGGGTAAAMISYITWAIAQNSNPCSAYYQSLDTTKIAADGFSCGGLMAENASSDPRFTAVGITSSGLFNADANVYSKIHTPFKIMNGGPSTAGNDMAYANGLRDYNEISALGKPIIYFSMTNGGHGTGLENPKGDYNSVNLAWLNWQLKGDTTATGKAFLIGPNCKYCKSNSWVFKLTIQP